MQYRVLFRPRAIRQLYRLPAAVHPRIARAIDALGEQPRPEGVSKVEGTDLWRIRVGDYRVIYWVDDTAREIVVVRIGHRREVYRNLQGSI